MPMNTELVQHVHFEPRGKNPRNLLLLLLLQKGYCFWRKGLTFVRKKKICKY